MLPTKDELRKRYASYSNDRLLSVLHNKEEYTEDALAAAQAEADLRNIAVSEVKEFLFEKEKQQAMAKVVSYIPLSFWEKTFFFFVWFAPWFLGGAFRMNYAEDGLVMKFKQSRAFAIAGFSSLMINSFGGVYLNLSGVEGTVTLVLFFVAFYWLEKRIRYNLN